uniref:Gnk2-homologous domain-containing protein n=1 Tax=Chenopodium quinoa TaxID=63459 RepID=A0A803NDX2_CHEQI
MFNAPNITKPGCPRKCGNLTVPYPFGVGLGAGCSKGIWYDIFCMTSSDPPKAFSTGSNDVEQNAMEILDISETQIRLKNQISYVCFNSTAQTSPMSSDYTRFFLKTVRAPYSVSGTANKLFAVGCRDYPRFTGSIDTGLVTLTDDGTASCRTNCSSGGNNVVASECNGIGCCQANIPKGMRSYTVTHDTFDSNHSTITILQPLTAYDAPLVLDWVASNKTCANAKRDLDSYECKENTMCVDATDSGIGGYRCSCLPGYQGHPYLSPGCTGVGLGSLSLLLTLSWAFLASRKRNLTKMKETFFQRNGGSLLKQLISPNKQDDVEQVKVFTIDELKVATKNFKEERIVGRGWKCIDSNGIGNYTKNSLFHSNLLNALSNLTSLSSSNIFSNYSEGVREDAANEVFALYDCRNDLPLRTCHDCVEEATKNLLEICTSKEAIAHYEQCMLRYANRPIYNIMELKPQLYFCEISIPDGGELNRTVEPILKGLIDQATMENSSRYFGLGDESYFEYQRVYSMVQCTPDISREQCKECLMNSLNYTLQCSNGSMMSSYHGVPSCFMRYDFVSFYNISSPSPSPVPLMAINQSTHSRTTSNNGGEYS